MRLGAIHANTGERRFLNLTLIELRLRLSCEIGFCKQKQLKWKKQAILVV